MRTVAAPLRSALAAAGFVLCAVLPAPSSAQSPSVPVGTIVNFGPNLQQVAGGVCRQPEGIAIDPAGNFYLASNSDSATTVGHVCVLDPQGNLTDIIDVPSVPGVSVIGLVGELWEDGFLYVCDQSDNVAPHGRVLKINPHTHAITTAISGLEFPNGMAEDANGTFYVTDSLFGRVYQFTGSSTQPTVWLQDPSLLSNNPNQPVGANDLAFDADGDFLYISNAGNRQILRVPIRHGRPGAVQVFADGATLDTQLGLPSPTVLNFADGMQFDVAGNLYAMANITNEVEVFAPNGSLIHRYAGTGNNALDFNASPIFKGNRLYMTNMSATDGGINSKVSVMQAQFSGISLN